MELNRDNISRFDRLYSDIRCSWDHLNNRYHCGDPRYETYCQEWRKAFDIWREAGRQGPVPDETPAVIECEKCEYADKELGVFDGKVSGMMGESSPPWTIPVSLKNRKKVYINNVNQKKT